MSKAPQSAPEPVCAHQTSPKGRPCGAPVPKPTKGRSKYCEKHRDPDYVRIRSAAATVEYRKAKKSADRRAAHARAVDEFAHALTSSWVLQLTAQLRFVQRHLTDGPVTADLQDALKILDLMSDELDAQRDEAAAARDGGAGRG